MSTGNPAVGSCGSCGTPLPDDAPWCSRCGARTVAPAPWAPEDATSTLLAGTLVAPLGRRVGAAVLDVVVVLGGAVAGSIAGRIAPTDTLATVLRGATGLACAALVVALGLGWALRGRTLGQGVLRLRTVDALTGLPPGPGRAPWSRGLRVVDTGSGRDPVLPVAGPSLAHHPAASVAAAPAAPAVRPAPAAPAGPAAAGWVPHPIRAAVLTASDQRIEITGSALVGRGPVTAPDEPVVQLVAVMDLTRSMSATHAMLTWDGSVLWVTDRGSANGTTVVTPDGARLAGEPGVALAAHPGSTVSFGDRLFRVRTAR